MTDFPQGDTVQLDAFWFDRNKNATTPTTQELKVYDPKGAEALTKTQADLIQCTGCDDDDCTPSTNHYYYDFDLEDDCELGTYYVRWNAVVSSKDYLKKSQFQVTTEEIEP